MFANRPIRVNVPLAGVHRGELFAVHVTLEARAVNERGGESASQAFIQDPQHGVGLIASHGLKRRGKPRFKEPRRKPLAEVRCPAGPRRHAGSAPASRSHLIARSSEAVARSAVRAALEPSRADRDGATSAHRRAPGPARHARGVISPAGRRVCGLATETFRPASSRSRSARTGRPSHSSGSRCRLDASPVREARRHAVRAASRSSTTTTSRRHPRSHHRWVSFPAVPSPHQRRVIPSPASGLDTAFGSATVSSRHPWVAGQGEAVVIQPRGGIVTAGWRTRQRQHDFALTRNDATGNLDRCFGTGGIATHRPRRRRRRGLSTPRSPRTAGSSPSARTDDGRHPEAGLRHRPLHARRHARRRLWRGRDRHDRLLRPRRPWPTRSPSSPTARSWSPGSPSTRPGIDSDFALARYNANGTLDAELRHERDRDHGPRARSADDTRALAIEPDGADRRRRHRRRGHRHWPATRTDGKLDSTFGDNGTTITPTRRSSDVANGVALTPDGDDPRSPATRSARTLNRDFMLARYTRRRRARQRVRR